MSVPSSGPGKLKTSQGCGPAKVQAERMPRLRRAVLIGDARSTGYGAPYCGLERLPLYEA